MTYMPTCERKKKSIIFTTIWVLTSLFSYLILALSRSENLISGIVLTFIFFVISTFSLYIVGYLDGYGARD